MSSLITIILILFTAFTTLADNSNNYFKGAIGIHKINSIKENHEGFTSPIKHESLLSPHFDFGFGRYFSNNYRFDFTYHQYYPYFDTSRSNFITEDRSDYSTTTGAVSIKRRANVEAIMLTAHKDFFENKGYKIFIGAAIGVATIKEKTSFLVRGNIIKDGQVFTFPLNTSTQTSKKKHNFAYTFSIGTSVKINPKVHMDTTYCWHNFGKTKHTNAKEDFVIPNNKYQGHKVTIGLRFDI